MNRLVRSAGLAVVATACLVGAAPAAAGTLTVDAGRQTYTGAPGETNTVTIDRADWVVRDATAKMTRGTGCTDPSPDRETMDDDPHALRCGSGYGGQRSRVELGDGNDSYTADAGGIDVDSVDGGDGDDTITVSAWVSSATGGAGADTVVQLHGTSGYGASALLDGGPGNDRLSARSVYARLEGGDGDDELQAGSDDAVVTFLRPRPPACNGVANGQVNIANPTLLGGPGNDRLGGGGADDAMSGGDGDDLLLGGQGNDMLLGGSGSDTLEGEDGDDGLLGEDGNDRLAGGRDASFAGDQLVGGPGSDLLVGGEGFLDRACYGDRAGPVQIDLRQPGGEGEPGENDTIREVEQIRGSEHGDTITAGAGGLVVEAGGGDDTVTGGPANDHLVGATGIDTIDGGDGNDVVSSSSGRADDGDDLRGGPGNDDVRGARGDDRLRGDAGDDRITGDRGDDWIDGGPGGDAISAVESGGVNHSPIVSLVHGDQVWCGTGADEAVGDYADGIGPDCEFADEGTPKWRAVRVGRRAVVTLRVRCAWHESVPCRGVASVRAQKPRASWTFLLALNPGLSGLLTNGTFGPPADCSTLADGRELARGKFDVRAGRVGTVTMKVTPAALRVLRRRACVVARVGLPFSGPQKVRYGSSRTLALRATSGLLR